MEANIGQFLFWLLFATGQMTSLTDFKSSDRNVHEGSFKGMKIYMKMLLTSRLKIGLLSLFIFFGRAIKGNFCGEATLIFCTEKFIS